MDVLLDNPLESLDVSLGVLGGAELSWLPKVDLPFPEPWQFRVEVADTDAGDWETVDTIVDGNWACLDPLRYRYDVLAELWYRVVLVDGVGVEHASESTAVGTPFDKRDWVVARERCRQAQQALRLGTGRTGWLRKRRGWGALCDVCGDVTTGKSTNSQCETCYGTGILGGYHEPVEFPIQLDNEVLSQADTAAPGQRANKVSNLALAVNFPRVAPYDLWIDANSDRRWMVQPGSVAATVSLRGVPIVVNFVLQPVPTTSVLYLLSRGIL